jgi:multisubunit Na+/H+ antiporter MnhE subunit
MRLFIKSFILLILLGLFGLFLFHLINVLRSPLAVIVRALSGQLT